MKWSQLTSSLWPRNDFAMWWDFASRDSRCLDPRNREKLLWSVCGFFLGTLQNSSSIALSQEAQVVKNLPAMQETGFDPRVGKMPWRREWQCTPVFLPGKFHGQRSLIGHSPWNHKELHMTEQLTNQVLDSPALQRTHCSQIVVETISGVGPLPKCTLQEGSYWKCPFGETKGPCGYIACGHNCVWLYCVWVTDPWMSQEEGRQPQCEPRFVSVALILLAAVFLPFITSPTHRATCLRVHFQEYCSHLVRPQQALTLVEALANYGIISEHIKPDRAPE